jgi:hypothetical protein
MPLYKCDFCNISTKIKQHYMRHLKTKKHRVNAGILIFDGKETCPEIGAMTPNDPKMTPNDPKMTPNDPKMTPNKPQFKCDYCDKTFSTKAHKRRHELHKCKENNDNVYKILNNQDAKIKILEKEKKELYRKIDELIKKVGDTNIQNNIENKIIINSYGNEDLSHITDKIKDELLKIPYGAIPKLIETIHFNDKMPQNKNIKYPNKKENVVSVYQGDKWVFKDKNETINDLIDSKYCVIDTHYDEIDTELPTFTKKSYSSFKKVYEGGDEEFVKNLKKECDMVLLNNRN